MTASNITAIDANTTVTTTVVVPPQASNNKASPEDKGRRILTHKLLARQLEYYFSTANLSKDTYLSTLRDLNDSYVPVSIIANFGKVQALAPYESALEAVVIAATDHSDLLEIVELDEEGKKISKKVETEKATTTILAVGSTTGLPIPVSQIPKMEKPKRTNKIPESSPSIPKVVNSTFVSNVQNTIIIREVAKEVGEETLKNLFDFEGCPSVKSIREDLHNCWFVTLETNSKDDMFNVMMKLRSSKFPSGDSVKARLKSAASASPLTPNAVVYNPKISTMYAPQFNSNNGGNTNSRKKRSKGRNNNSSGAGSNSNHKSKNGEQNVGNVSKRKNSKDMSNKSSNSNDNAKTKPKKVTLKPPSMGESNFPSLPPTSDGNSKPFQVEKVPINCEKERHSASGFSDSSSTATTSTASTPTEAPPSGVVAGGYAAALLRPAMPLPKVEKPRRQPQSAPKATKDTQNNAPKNKEGKQEEKKIKESNDQPPVNVKPPVWGQGRSFADIVSA